MGKGDIFHFYLYTSDDGTAYGVKLSEAVAAAGGFSGPISPKGVKIWPFGHRNLRKVTGVDATTGARNQLPIHDPSNTLYVNGGGYTITSGGSSTAYAVESSIGEAQKANHIG